MKWQNSYIFKYTAHGESAFMKAAEMGHSKTVEEIIQRAKINPLGGTRQIEAIKMAVHQVEIEYNKIYLINNTIDLIRFYNMS